MEKLTRHLFAWDPKAEYMDWYERALYNHILGSEDPENGMMCYFMPLDSGHVRKFSTPFDSFWCCVGTGMENHMLHGEAIYYRHGSDRLWVNLFAPSEVTWREAGAKVRQDTAFPEDGAVGLSFALKSPRTFAVSIRKPAWADEKIGFDVDGKPVQAEETSDGYLTIRRRWSDGDRLEFRLPMRLRVEPALGDPSMVSLAYGPLVLCADMDQPVGTPSPGDPAIVAGGQPISAWMKRLPGPGLRFQSSGAFKPCDYGFLPFSAVRHHRSATYFKLATQP